MPPRAQAAHQMATCALNNILAQMKGKPLKAHTYKDHGSLVSLSNYSTVGSLMGNLMRGSMMVEGAHCALRVHLPVPYAPDCFRMVTSRPA